MRRVMLVDDEPHVLSALRRLLARSLPQQDVRVELYLDPLQALARTRHARFDVVVSDYRMPAMDGVKLLSRLREIQPDTVRIILSASTDFDAVQAAVNEADIFKYLVKPWTDEALLLALSEAFARHDHAAETHRLAQAHKQGQGKLSPEEAERQRLEALEPGITRVRWDTDGSVLLDDV